MMPWGRLHWALLFSLALHAVWLSLGLSPTPPLSSSPAPTVQAKLAPAKLPVPAKLAPQSSLLPLPQRLGVVSAAHVTTPVPSAITASSTPELAAASESQSAPAVLPSPTTAMPPLAVATVSADGLREYRVALARAASRFKEEYDRNYSALERERRRGWEGRVEMTVRAMALGGVSRVTLARSSGHSVLDEQAQELIGRAVQATPLPGSLRGQTFSLSVVLDFRLEND